MSATQLQATTAAFTIAEWCHWRRVSQPTYFKLQREGRGPKVMRIGRKVLIPHAADEAWALEIASEQKSGAL